jgi:SAM-dependent methyltransferase
MTAERAAHDYWESLFASRGWGAYPPEDLIRFMARTFRAASDKSRVHVLEIGCGPGPNIWYLVREGFSVAGIDGSPTAVRQAGERLAAEKLPSTLPRVDLRVGDFASLPWADASFDAVVDIASLYANRMSTINSAVAGVLRVLKPGGVFLSRMFGPRTLGSDTGEELEPGTRRRPTTGPCSGNELAHFFTREELPQVFAGFTSMNVDYIHRSDANGAVEIFEWLVSARK